MHEHIVRHLLVSLSIAALAAGCQPPDPRFIAAHHENMPGALKGGWEVHVARQSHEVEVSTWTRETGVGPTYTGMMNLAGQQRLTAATAEVRDDWDPFDACANPAGEPCTTYQFFLYKGDGNDDVVAARARGDLAAFVQDLADQVPTGSSDYVDGIH